MGKVHRWIIVTMALAVIVIIGGSMAEAATIHVDDDAICPGSGTVANPYCSIQYAIDQANTGDEVLVHNGTYMENIDFKGKVITVKSENGADSTIIDGGQNGSVVTFNNGEGVDSVLQGFTIKNGKKNNGGGIYCYNSSPTIIDNIIRNNLANDDGGGIYCEFSSPFINNNIIRNNSAGDNGGGVYCINASSPSITKNIIDSNSAANDGGGIYCYKSSPLIKATFILKNSARDGGGIYCSYSSPNIVNCIIAANIAAMGDGLYAYANGHGNYSNPHIINCTITDNANHGIYTESWNQGVANPIVTNSILWGNGDDLAGVNSSASVTYSNIEDGDAGEGNISCDPQFIGNGDYHLANTSCSIDKGTSDGASLDDIDGESRPKGAGYDMGADEVSCPDVDGDGYYGEAGCGTEVDCNEENDVINPETVWYKDADGDKYSDETNKTQCSQPSQYYLAADLIATSGDCDDTNELLNPGIAEICDGIDNNCDDQKDEGCDVTIDLNSGWNLVSLIGCNSYVSFDIAAALASIDGQYVSIWAYVDGAWKVYDPENPVFSDLTTMEPSYGYWINTTEACTWILPSF